MTTPFGLSSINNSKLISPIRSMRKSKGCVYFYDITTSAYYYTYYLKITLICRLNACIKKKTSVKYPPKTFSYI